MKTESQYQTRDIYEAAYLVYCGLKFVDKKTEGKITTLYFSDPEKAKNFSLEYYNGAEAPANNLFASFRNVKDYIFRK